MAQTTVHMEDSHWVRYRVSVRTQTPTVGERFVHWMKQEHGPDLLSIGGCLECRVYRLSPTDFSCEYIFESQKALDRYYKHNAEAMRAKGQAHFSSGELEFKRDESECIAQALKSR